jgi:hypothetical protein
MHIRFRAAISTAIISIVLVTFSTLTLRAERATSTAAGPILLKRTVIIQAHRYLRYWKTPKSAQPIYDTRSWLPRVRFDINGPVLGGSQWIVEINTPDGKPWITYECQTNEVGNGILESIKTPEKTTDSDDLEKKATILTGTFPFKIILKNELQGGSQVMMQGKFKIDTIVPDQSIPENRGKKEFFVDHDWRLPIGAIFSDTNSDEDVPPLGFKMWFRGKGSTKEMTAVLFHDGKEVANVKSTNAADSIGDGGYDVTDAYYFARIFTFLKVKVYDKNKSAATYPDSFFLDKHPGNYEIKILRNGELSRAGQFVVGPDGRIVDNQIAVNNKLGGSAIVVPLKVMGADDPKYKAASWQTDAYYGNPLTGFTLP